MGQVLSHGAFSNAYYYYRFLNFIYLFLVCLISTCRDLGSSKI